MFNKMVAFPFDKLEENFYETLDRQEIDRVKNLVYVP